MLKYAGHPLSGDGNLQQTSRIDSMCHQALTTWTHIPVLGLGDWCLWYLTNTFTKIIQIIYSHPQSACCSWEIVTYSRCDCPGEKMHVCMSGHTLGTSLTTLGRARTCSRSWKSLCSTSFFVFLSFCYSMLCCMFQALFQNWAFWWG